jgi:hypothetical protein
MLRASNCVSNLQGMDRDVAVSLRKEIQKHAQEMLLGNSLPTSEDLDRVAEEQEIKERTKV